MDSDRATGWGQWWCEVDAAHMPGRDRHVRLHCFVYAQAKER
jgi:hypothetical protein